MFRYICKLTYKHVNYNLNNVHNFNSVHKLGVLNHFRNLSKPNLNLWNRNFHSSTKSSAKIFQDLENNYAYNILQEFPMINKFNGASIVSSKIETEEQFNATLEQNWRASTATNILHAFENTLDYCVLNNIDLSDTRFDKLVDGLMDNVEKLTVDQIAALLHCISKFPQTESFKSHNFHDIWSALDDVCCWRMLNWSFEQMFQFADLWYKLNLGRISNYMSDFLQKLYRKPESLTKEQLICSFFYFNVRRSKSIEFVFESALENQIYKMTVDEMAVVAMGFFKSQTKIKLKHILLCMINKIIEESKTIHELSLCALIKVIRFSSHPVLANPIYSLLDKLTPEIERLSILCCLHIAILGSNLQLFHIESLTKISQKIADNITNVDKVRLKDMERLLLMLSMFNFDPKTTPDIFEATVKELYRMERSHEFDRHPKCLPSTLLYLSMRNVYCYDLMSNVLDANFITATYGKTARLLPKEMLTLNTSIEIECPDYKGNRLDLQMQYKATKWLSDFTPTYDQHKRLSAADKLILDVIDNVQYVVGGKHNMHIEHVLPQFSKADIILCKDKTSGRFVEPKGFENYILGDVMKPCDTNNFDWFAVMVIGWNGTIRDSSVPVGIYNMKSRQLKILGYNPVFVIWNEYGPLKKDEKLNYISSKINNS